MKIANCGKRSCSLVTVIRMRKTSKTLPVGKEDEKKEAEAAVEDRNRDRTERTLAMAHDNHRSTTGWAVHRVPELQLRLGARR
jgi:hypothetical protein